MDDLILRTVARVLVPLVQLCGLAIIAYGHVSPGGGFAGGTVLAAGFVLYALAFGQEALDRRLPERTARTAESLGAAWFAVLGLVGLAAGRNYLANVLPPGSPGRLLSGGIIALVTAGVGLKVAATMVTLFRRLMGGEGGERP
ncbi:MAG: MnhB domain-containing protein [Bacillota bacterium]|nr:MnhB domain-containing protein [Bacillota bacterium]